MNKIYTGGKHGMIHFIFPEIDDTSKCEKVFNIWFTERELNKWLMTKRGIYSLSLKYMEK